MLWIANKRLFKRKITSIIMSKNLHRSNEKLLDEQCKYVFRMANEMKDEESQFHFVHGHISAVEDGMKEGEQKKKIVKSMASWALKEFNAKENYKMDLRMLDFWKLLGKYSNDLKMEGVMENLHRVGHFNTQPAFYLMWAEHWASLNNRRNFDKIVAMCENECKITPSESSELFKPLTCKYFGEVSEETDTMALIKEIADRPEKLRRTLTMFPSKVQEQPQPLPSNHEQFSIFQDQAKSMLCVDADDITVSGAHGKFTSAVSTSTPRRSVAFCAFDPPMMEMDNDALMGPSTPGQDNEERGLFAPMSSESKLQRRLSLGKKTSMIEVGNTMPLKIGPVILEETEEFSKEF